MISRKRPQFGAMMFAGVVTPAVAHAASGGGMTAYTFTTLATFDDYISKGQQSSLAIDGAGNLYGVSNKGGPGGQGSVFKVAAGTHAISEVVSFNTSNSSAGYAPLTQVFSDAAGDLTGSTTSGGNGAGTIFQVSAGSTVPQTIFTFNASSTVPNVPGTPQGLTPDAAGDLYGIGDNTLFVLNHSSHTLTTLYTFTNPGGFSPSPSSAPVMDKYGNLYGTTGLGPGTSTAGSVYRYNPTTQQYDTLYAFKAPVDRADFQLTFDSQGNLYIPNGGSILEIAASQTLVTGTAATTTVCTFPVDGSGNSPDGAGVNGGLVFDSAGDILGTTSSGGISPNGFSADGTAFEVTASTHQLVLLNTFFDGNPTVAAGGEPMAGLIMDSNGDFFGTTTEGGSSIGPGGTLFELSPAAVPEPAGLSLLTLGVIGLARGRHIRR